MTTTIERNHFNTTGYTLEQFERLLDAGATVKEIETLWAKEEYRREYNARPDVRAKRAEYNRTRNARLAMLKGLLK